MSRRIPLVSTVVRLLPLSLLVDNPVRLRERFTRLDGRRVRYGEVMPASFEGGPAGTVVLVHGWGLAHASYGRAAKEIADHGFRVVMPDLPGFGGSGDLPFGQVSLEAFSSWLQGFLLALELDGSESCSAAHVVGHSFGGAVAARLAHDAPHLVASLVLVDAATGATWSRDGDVERLLTDRPLWDWAYHLVHEFPRGEFPSAARTVLRDLGHNVLWHLPTLGLVAHLTRRSDIRSELRTVAGHGIPVSILWAEDDRVVTRACFDDQCTAIGLTGTVVSGNHGWPMAEPAAFAGAVVEHLRPLVTG